MSTGAGVSILPFLNGCFDVCVVELMWRFSAFTVSQVHPWRHLRDRVKKDGSKYVLDFAPYHLVSTSSSLRRSRQKRAAGIFFYRAAAMLLCDVCGAPPSARTDAA